MATPVLTVYSDGTLAMSAAGAFQNPGSIDYPTGSITNTHIAANAAISGSKIQRNAPWIINQEGTATDRTFQVFAKGAGSFILFTVWCGTAPTGANEVTIDLQKGGASVLSAVVTLDSSSSANTEYTGTISSAAFADGDRIGIVINETEGGTPSQDCADIGVRLDWDEAYAAS